MDEFRVEYYIDGEGEQNTKLLSLNEKYMEEWKIAMEARALSEYYNKKIKVSGKKI